MKGDCWSTKYGDVEWTCKLTWADLFALLAPYLLQNPNDQYAKTMLTASLHDKSQQGGTSPTLNDQDFQTAKVIHGSKFSGGSIFRDGQRRHGFILVSNT